MQIQTKGFPHSFLTKTKMAKEHARVHDIVFEARLLGAVGTSEVLLQRFKGNPPT